MTAIDLDAIRQRWERARLTDLDDGASHYRRITTATRSARDVQELLAEVDRLRAEVRRLTALARCCSQDPGHEGPCAWHCSACAGTGDCPDCEGVRLAPDGCSNCSGTGDCSNCSGSGEFVDAGDGHPVAAMRGGGR